MAFGGRASAAAYGRILGPWEDPRILTWAWNRLRKRLRSSKGLSVHRLLHSVIGKKSVMCSFFCIHRAPVPWANSFAMGSGNGILRCFEGAWSCPSGRLSVLQAECGAIKAICKLHGLCSVWLIFKGFGSMRWMHYRALSNFVKCLKPISRISRDEKMKNL